MTNLQERNKLFDLLKGFAIVLMVQVHLWELFADPELVMSYAGRLGMFAGGPPVAPLFMIIFGYFAAASRKSFTSQLLRALKLFALGMLLNLLLNLNLILQVKRGSMQVDLWPYIFGVDILHLAGLSMIILLVLTRIEKARSYIAALLIQLVLLIPACLPTHMSVQNTGEAYLASYFIGISHWSYFPLLPWLAYPLAGLILYDIRQSAIWQVINKKYLRWILTAAAALVVCFTFPFGVRIAANLPAYYHHSFLFFGWTILFLIAYSRLVQQLNHLLGKTKLFGWLRWMGRHVTLLYVIQWIIIGNMATPLFQSVTSFGTLFVYFICILIACCLIAAAFLKLQQAPKAS